MRELVNVKAIIQKWEREGIELLPPHEEKEVLAILSPLGRPFSQDVVSLYCMTGGMAEGLMDDEGLSLWTMERLVKENLNQQRLLLLFMDALIDSHFYGLQYEDAETSSVHIDYFGGETPKLVAGSLEEFFRLYLSDPLELFL